jgi:hypothetical protein
MHAYTTAIISIVTVRVIGMCFLLQTIKGLNRKPQNAYT